MQVSRGAFLKACATAVVGLGARSPIGELVLNAAPLAASALPATAGTRFDWAIASADMFRPHVRSRFALRTVDGSVAPVLTLDRVIEPRRQPGVEQFSLLFHAAAGSELHGVHTFQHAALGEFDLFIAPVGAPHGRTRVYEACFSRLVRGGPDRG